MSRLRHRVKPSARSPRRPVSPKARLFVRALESRIVPATFTVTNIGDAGTGTGMSGDLRYCITQANALGGANTIDATGITGTITLLNGALTISNSLTITGPANNGLAISGNSVSQVFTVSGTGRTVVFKNLEISGGAASGAGTISNGGAVCVGSNAATFDTDWIHNNKANIGGAIGSTAGATIVVKNSAITGNSAEFGGGLYGSMVGATTTVVVLNSTMSGNTGAAIGIEGEPDPPPGLLPGYTPAAVSIDNCTITGNSGAGVAEIGLVGLPVNVVSSIISGNVNTSDASDIYAEEVSASRSAIGTISGIGSFWNLGGNLPIGASPKTLYLTYAPS